MTTQHAPHTTPLWRRFFSLPKTGSGWWAVGLGVPCFVLIVFFHGLEILGWTSTAESVGLAIALMVLVVGLPGGIFGLIAVGHRDRSLLVWVAQVPALRVFSVFVWAAISILGGVSGWYSDDPDVRVTFPIAVLLWAVLNFTIIWSHRNLPQRRSP